jgi:hypothetical protein
MTLPITYPNLAHEKLVNILGGHGPCKFIHGSLTCFEIAIVLCSKMWFGPTLMHKTVTVPYLPISFLSCNFPAQKNTLIKLYLFIFQVFSTIFHSRDVPLTEKLDYFSAFSIVVYMFLTFFLRILGSWRSVKRIQWSNLVAIMASMALFFRFVYNAYIVIRYHSRFFVRVWHETMYAYTHSVL